MSIFQQSAFNSSTSSATVSVSWGGATAAGNCLFAVGLLDETGGDSGDSISAPSGWTLAKTVLESHAGRLLTCSLFFKSAAASQSSTGNFSATTDGTQNDFSVAVGEFNIASCTIDKTASATGGVGSTTMGTGTTATTASATELCIGGMGNVVGTGGTPTNSFSNPVNNFDGVDAISLVYLSVSSTGTYGTTQSRSNSLNAGCIATFTYTLPATNQSSGFFGLLLGMTKRCIEELFFHGRRARITRERCHRDLRIAMADLAKSGGKEVIVVDGSVIN